jgi:hypothetical protein
MCDYSLHHVKSRPAKVGARIIRNNLLAGRGGKRRLGAAAYPAKANSRWWAKGEPVGQDTKFAPLSAMLLNHQQHRGALFEYNQFANWRLR